MTWEVDVLNAAFTAMVAVLSIVSGIIYDIGKDTVEDRIDFINKLRSEIPRLNDRVIRIGKASSEDEVITKVIYDLGVSIHDLRNFINSKHSNPKPQFHKNLILYIAILYGYLSWAYAEIRHSSSINLWSIIAFIIVTIFASVTIIYHAIYRSIITEIKKETEYYREIYESLVAELNELEKKYNIT